MCRIKGRNTWGCHQGEDIGVDRLGCIWRRGSSRLRMEIKSPDYIIKEFTAHAQSHHSCSIFFYKFPISAAGMKAHQCHQGILCSITPELPSRLLISPIWGRTSEIFKWSIPIFAPTHAVAESSKEYAHHWRKGPHTRRDKCKRGKEVTYATAFLWAFTGACSEICTISHSVC